MGGQRTEISELLLRSVVTCVCTATFWDFNQGDLEILRIVGSRNLEDTQTSEKAAQTFNVAQCRQKESVTFTVEKTETRKVNGIS